MNIYALGNFYDIVFFQIQENNLKNLRFNIKIFFQKIKTP